MVALDQTTSSPRWALIFAAVLLVAEFAFIGVIFKHGIDFYCLDNWPAQACRGASNTLVSLYCVLGALSLLYLLRPAQFRTLVAQAGGRSWALVLNLIGVGVTLIPLTFLENGAGAAVLLPAFLCWAIGMSALLAGIGLYIAPLSAWGRFITATWGQLIPVVLTGAIAPFFAVLIRPLWRLDTMSDFTFEGVVRLLHLLGYEPELFEGTKIIGVDPFYINVAPQCSGIEGIALVTLFVTLYLGIFRKELRFPRALLLYPIGILTSVAFNVVRITVLLIIGLEGSPELAVGGFHSHAGWLLFTIIAISIVVAAQSVPALQKAPHGPVASMAVQRPLVPFFQDPEVARILPFAIFMFSALLASAFSQSPGVVYPLRVLAMAAALAIFFPVYRNLRWRLNPTALGVGFAIGLIWVLIPVAPSEGTAPYGSLTGGLLVAWFVLRGIGTILLVPIIEELFFRGYLEDKLRFGAGLSWKIGPAVIVAGLFAVLHDRWMEAFFAGLAFSWLVQRRGGRLEDAILSHAAANAFVFAAAIVLGNLAIL